MTRSWKSSIISLIVSMFTFDMPPITVIAAGSYVWRAVRTVVEFVVELPRAIAATALRLFGPDGVFAAALMLLEAAIMTAYKSWRGEPGAKHYKAPGSWTRCAST